MHIAPSIVRLHTELDSRQRKVIAHAHGPLLVIAGPGSGKTHCVALRAVNLLLTRQCPPGGLVLCTFGRNAALELRQRFAAAAQACGVLGNISQVSVSTIHSLCHRILASHPGTAGLRPGYGLLNETGRQMLLHREFDRIFGPDRDSLSGRGWRGRVQTVAEAAKYFDRICDELIDPLDLEYSARAHVGAMGRCLQRYRDLLLDRNLVDFAHLQVWAEQLLRNDDIAAGEAHAVRHLMVDEFQDTSRVQMRILHRLAVAHGNVAVVGDDDQSIYRFRGASVANLLDFPRLFPGCRTLEITTNYRSHRDIVAAVGRWMEAAAPWEVDGRAFRYAKCMAPHEPGVHPDYPGVISVLGQNPEDEAAQLGELLRLLRDNGVIAGYGQVALLLHSVRNAVSGPYLDGLQRAGISARCEPAGHVRVAVRDEVLITTIHQAKGREWDVVIVGSLGGPDMATDRIGRNLADCGVYAGEPEGLTPDFDRARQHYVAFTRARHLLVLTASGDLQARFSSIWKGAARWPSVDRSSLSGQRFGGVEPRQRETVWEIDHLDRLVINLTGPRGVMRRSVSDGLPGPVDRGLLLRWPPGTDSR